jgi:hypothetical protein
VTNLDDGVVQLLAGAGKIQQALRGGAAQHGLAYTSHYLIAAVHEWPLRVASNFSIRPNSAIDREVSSIRFRLIAVTPISTLSRSAVGTQTAV